MLIITALDDVSGVTASYSIERLIEKGANNVHVIQTVTKKGRLGLIFFIDVDEVKIDDVGEVVVTELGSSGYNVVNTKHIAARTRVALHKVIVRFEANRIEGIVRIKSSFSPKGKLVRLSPEHDDLSKIIKNAKKKLGVELTLRRLKKQIIEEVNDGRDKTILEIGNCSSNQEQ